MGNLTPLPHPLLTALKRAKQRGLRSPVRVEISPRFDAFYCSYYLHGLWELLGRRNATVSRWPFVALDEHHSMALRILDPEFRVFIDARDESEYDEAALAWCNVYAKVNVDPLATPSPKVVCIGPSFAVRTYGLLGSGLTSLRSWRAAKIRARNCMREHFANYWRSYRHRLPLSEYRATPSSPRYIFSMSTLWKRDTATNEFRTQFIRACMDTTGIVFEGGFAPRTRRDVPGFESLTTSRQYRFKQYIRKVKQSAVVFNTPAVKGCHGWKLGEFLALGKAIISTPLLRSLPRPLEHGKHVHYVDGSFAEIKQAVGRITNDEPYRRHLERNARAYFEDVCSPVRSIEAILARSGTYALWQR